MSHLDEGQLHELLDGELDDATRTAALAHLATCERCKALYDEAASFLAEANGLIDAVQLPSRRAAEPLSRPTAEPPSREAAEPPVLPPAPSRIPLYRSLAWAASLVLAVGIGWYANESRVAPSSPAAAAADQRSQVPSPESLAEATEADKAAAPSPDQQSQVPSRDGARTAPSTRAARPATRDSQLATAPLSPTAGNAQPAPPQPGALPLPAPVAAPSDELASSALSLQQGRAREAGPPAAAAATQPLRPAPEESLERKENRGFAAADQVTGLAAKTAVAGSRPIKLEEAVRTLGGSIRLIDGLTPKRVLTVPVRLVAGADAGSPVVRVVYQDPPGRELWLDQQRTEFISERHDRRAPGATALLPGDTLVSAAPNGARSLAWVDQNGFRLRLTGFLATDSLRLLRDRVH